MTIKQNDKVIVIAGKDKGKTGKVIKSLPKMSRVIVEGINMTKKHQKPRKQGQKGQIVTIAMPIHISNVRLEGEAKAKSEKKPAKPASKK